MKCAIAMNPHVPGLFIQLPSGVVSPSQVMSKVIDSTTHQLDVENPGLSTNAMHIPHPIASNKDKLIALGGFKASVAREVAPKACIAEKIAQSGDKAWNTFRHPTDCL